MKRAFAFLFCVLCCLAFSVQAFAQAPADKDILVFNNGDQLTGQFERSTGSSVVFKSDMAGELTIGWDKIKQLHTNGRYAVLENGFKAKGTRKLNDARIPQGSLSMANQTITIQQDAGPAVTLPTKDADFVLDSKTYEHDLRGQQGFLGGWNGAVTAGAALVRATQNSEQFTTALNLVRLDPNVTWLDTRTRDKVDVVETYGKQTETGSPAVKNSIFHADAEHDIYYSPRAYALVSTAFDHNYSQGLNLQQIYGGGLGLTVFKTPKQELDLKAQAQYETQAYGIVPGSAPGTTANPSTQLIAATFAENYLRKFKTISIVEQLQLIPAFNDVNAYSANTNVGILFPVYKRLSFSFNTSDTYLGDPASGAQRNSFQVVTGITYKLR